MSSESSEAIAVNQDKLGIQGKNINISGTSEVWVGKVHAVSGSAYAVILLNRADRREAANITGHWRDIALVSILPSHVM